MLLPYLQCNHIFCVHVNVVTDYFGNCEADSNKLFQWLKSSKHSTCKFGVLSRISNHLNSTAAAPTCVLVESEVRGSSTRHGPVCNSTIFPRVRVIGHHSHNRSPRGALRAQADSVVHRVEGRSVIINVHHVHLHVGD